MNQRRRLRKIKEELPIADPHGLYLGAEFISYDTLHQVCSDIMHPANASFVEAELGKMHYTKDPTYNMKRGK